MAPTRDDAGKRRDGEHHADKKDHRHRGQDDAGYFQHPARQPPSPLPFVEKNWLALVRMPIHGFILSL
jgi:hypothetical protein